MLVRTFFYTLSLMACVHNPPSPVQKPYETCICGPLSNSEAEPFCAIWAPTQTLDAPQPVFEAEAASSCAPPDCSRYFSRFCKAIQMAPPVKKTVALPQKLPAAASCYCDSVLIENNKGQVLSFCAAWIEGGSHLIEYYAIEGCSPSRCKEAPFYKSKAICKDNFQSFYLPLQKSR